MRSARLTLPVLFFAFYCGQGKTHKILNVSYDPTREFYREFNDAFVRFWRTAHPTEKVEFGMSHGGSGKQARAVIDGLPADVVTLALAFDVDTIASEAHLLSKDWQKKLPFKSAPYTSTIVFLVRKGNPKGIKDWNDLIRPDVSIVVPNPKTSGGARWNYLAAYAYALDSGEGNDKRAQNFMRAFFANVVVLDSGARAATTTFLRRNIGDVLVAWQNEALFTLAEFHQQAEIVVPSLSIRAEPSVALVERNAAERGNTEIAAAYLQYLYSDEGQNIAAKHFFMPRHKTSLVKKYAIATPKRMVTVDSVFGGWAKAMQTHFADGGVFDQIYRN